MYTHKEFSITITKKGRPTDITNIQSITIEIHDNKHCKNYEATYVASSATNLKFGSLLNLLSICKQGFETLTERGLVLPVGSPRQSLPTSFISAFKSDDKAVFLTLNFNGGPDLKMNAYLVIERVNTPLETVQHELFVHAERVRKIKDEGGKGGDDDAKEADALRDKIEQLSHQQLKLEIERGANIITSELCTRTPITIPKVCKSLTFYLGASTSEAVVKCDGSSFNFAENAVVEVYMPQLWMRHLNKAFIDVKVSAVHVFGLEEEKEEEKKKAKKRNLVSIVLRNFPTSLEELTVVHMPKLTAIRDGSNLSNLALIDLHLCPSIKMVYGRKNKLVDVKIDTVPVLGVPVSVVA